MSRWTLTEETKNQYTPEVAAFLNEIKEISTGALREKDFSDTKLNPYTLGEILESMGYERKGQDQNGWELDFEVTYRKEGEAPVSVQGCGMTFELKLAELD